MELILAVAQLPPYEFENVVHPPLVGLNDPSAGPFDIFHIRVVGLPMETGFGLACNVHEGGIVVGGPTYTVAEQLLVPCAFVTVRVKVVVAASAAVVQFPPLEPVNDVHVPLVGLNDPSAGPLFIDHVSVEVSPGVIESGFAVSVHIGIFVTGESSSDIVIVNDFDTVVHVSESCTVKLYCSPVVFASLDTVPEITPPDDRFNPGGREPAVSVHVYELLPPEPESVAL